jgi:hypothetical protein
VGHGEIGSAVHSVVAESKEASSLLVVDPPAGYPLDEESFAKSDIVHVSIPFTAAFPAVAGKYFSMLQKDTLVVIHSTLPVGETRKLQAKFPGLCLVHSPVRGVHPNLHDSLKTFVKYFGATTRSAAERAAKHMGECGMPVKVLDTCENTEMIKLLSTTYYAKAVAFYKHTLKLVEDINKDHPEYGINFEDVLLHATEDYNKGYIAMGMPHVCRPELKVDHSEIGGHCLGPNAMLLWKDFQFDAVVDILPFVSKEHQFILDADAAPQDNSASISTPLIIAKK